jgi:hypothetical protein
METSVCSGSSPTMTFTQKVQGDIAAREFLECFTCSFMLVFLRDIGKAFELFRTLGVELSEYLTNKPCCHPSSL